VNGTKSLTGRVGQSCAAAWVANSPSAATTNARATERDRISVSS
jgi:hypothetical protein